MVVLVKIVTPNRKLKRMDKLTNLLFFLKHQQTGRRMVIRTCFGFDRKNVDVISSVIGAPLQLGFYQAMDFGL